LLWYATWYRSYNVYMEHTSFTPKLAQKSDAISQGLLQFARYVMIGMFALLPVLFIPGIPGFVVLGKSFFIAISLVIVMIAVSFAVLRNGAISFTMPPVLIAWWGLVGTAGISALLSSSPQFAFIGEALEPQTVAFLAIMGLLMSFAFLFKSARKATVYLFVAMLLSASVLSLWQVARVIFGVEFLGFGTLTQSTSTLIGNFNDVAIFVALMTVLSLITLVQVRLPNIAMWSLGGLIVVSLLLLVVVSFSMMWLILSLVSLSLLMYGLTRDRFGVSQEARAPQRISLPAIAIISIVFVVSTVFLIGGGALSSAVNRVTGINYLEVRPSIGATLDIMRSVYGDNAFTGIGTNQFSDAWQMHKDSSLNQTLFWNTPFSAASGYIPTLFITTGIFGVLTWFIFLSVVLYTSARFLFRSDAVDPFWYFIGSLSAASSLFVWLVAFFYVPGAVVLAVGALTTGLLVAAQQSAQAPTGVKINFLATTRTGFVLIAIVMVVVISSIGAGYYALRQFSALYIYAGAIPSAQASEDPIATVSTQLARAYSLHQTDVFAREIANYQLLSMNYLISLPSPSQVEQQKFQVAITNAIEAANEAIRLRPQNSQNWIALGDIYATLAAVNVEGAKDRAKEAYEKGRSYDPTNPYFDLQLGILAFRANDQAEARARIESALRLKSNYTDALYVMSQIDIAAGDLSRAIASTESLISLESNNPGRYYQLGVLHAANKNPETAVAAFSVALQLNPQFANALYYRALQLVALNQIDAAIKDLESVRDLNPDNAVVGQIIDKIRAGERDPEKLVLQAPVTEPSTVTTENSVTTTEEAPNSDLLTPVNTVENNNGNDQSAETSAPVTPSVTSSTTTTQ
jgi:tetratricopeptide (TPR) repeat protein